MQGIKLLTLRWCVVLAGTRAIDERVHRAAVGTEKVPLELSVERNGPSVERSTEVYDCTAGKANVGGAAVLPFLGDAAKNSCFAGSGKSTDRKDAPRAFTVSFDPRVDLTKDGALIGREFNVQGCTNLRLVGAVHIARHVRESLHTRRACRDSCQDPCKRR